MNIIDHIAAERKRLGMSVNELSDRTGKSTSFISDMWHRKDLRVSTAWTFIHALDGELIVRDADGNETVITAEP